MLQKTHQAGEQTTALRQQQHHILAENQELKGKLIDLRGKLMDKSVQMNTMEGMMNRLDETLQPMNCDYL